MGAGAGSDLDELEELAERINKTARTPATTVRSDPLPDWLQPCLTKIWRRMEGMIRRSVNNKQLHRSHQHPKLEQQQRQMTMMSSWSMRRLSRSTTQDEQRGDGKIIEVHDPKLFTEEEVRQHLLCHLPYRSWCHHFIRGRGRERDHRKQLEDHVEGIPEYHLDYYFPGDELGQRLTILVAVERNSRMKKAVVVPSKGSTGVYAARMAMELISECGDKDRDVIVKTDQEPAIKFLVDDVCMARTGARAIRELAPKNSKGSNGIVERAVQSVEQLVQNFEVGAG